MLAVRDEPTTPLALGLLTDVRLASPVEMGCGLKRPEAASRPPSCGDEDISIRSAQGVGVAVC